MDDSLLATLQRALEADTANIALREHVCSLLLASGRAEIGLAVARAGLVGSPANPELLRIAHRCAEAGGQSEAAGGYATLLQALGFTEDEPQAIRRDAQAAQPGPAPTSLAPSAMPSPDFEEPEGDPVPIADAPDSVGELLNLWEDAEAPEAPDIGELTLSSTTLADVGGMQEVKKRIESSFLMPLRNPEMQRAFGKSMRGGLLLWGPPGCGKTFMAKAIAGEVGASFYHVGLSDILDMWTGSSERNVSALFDVARRNAPCVLFLDEVDAIGQKRTQLRGGGGMRGVVNQMLQEMDGATKDNEGVFVLAATNHPWDIDSALLRPGRLDRMLLVLPPDPAAREAILQMHLRGKPMDRVKLDKIARATEGLTGADLALLCEQATEYAMEDSIRNGAIRPINMKDLTRAAKSVSPSHGPWFDSAKNFALFNNDSGRYDDLLDYMQRKR